MNKEIRLVRRMAETLPHKRRMFRITKHGLVSGNPVALAQEYMQLVELERKLNGRRIQAAHTH
jgi:hypothetical protein